MVQTLFDSVVFLYQYVFAVMNVFISQLLCTPVFLQGGKNIKKSILNLACKVKGTCAGLTLQDFKKIKTKK